MEYKQKPSLENNLPENFLYFKNEKTNLTIGFEKSNQMSVLAVDRIMKRVGFSYLFFVKVFYNKDNGENNVTAS